MLSMSAVSVLVAFSGRLLLLPVNGEYSLRDHMRKISTGNPICTPQIHTWGRFGHSACCFLVVSLRPVRASNLAQKAFGPTLLAGQILQAFKRMACTHLHASRQECTMMERSA